MAYDVPPRLGATERFTSPDVPEITALTFTVNSAVTYPANGGQLTNPAANVFNITALPDPYYCTGIYLSIELPNIYTDIRCRLSVLHPKAPAALDPTLSVTTLAGSQNIIISTLVAGYGNFYAGGQSVTVREQYYPFAPFAIYFNRGDALRVREDINGSLGRLPSASTKVPQYKIIFYMIKTLRY